MFSHSCSVMLMFARHANREEGMSFGTSFETAGDPRATAILYYTILCKRTLLGGRFLLEEARDRSC